MTLFTFEKLRREMKPSVTDTEAGVPGPDEHAVKTQKHYCRYEEE